MNNHNWTDNADNPNLTDNSNLVGEASSSNATGNLDDINMAISPDFTVEANLTNPSSASSPGNPDTACSSDQSAAAHLAPNTASNLYNPKKANNTGESGTFNTQLFHCSGAKNTGGIKSTAAKYYSLKMFPILQA